MKELCCVRWCVIRSCAPLDKEEVWPRIR
jgi:hypothetical protein